MYSVFLSHQMGKAEGIINDEIPNCWECPKCHKEGKTSKVRARPEQWFRNVPLIPRVTLVAEFTPHIVLSSKCTIQKINTDFKSFKKIAVMRL